MQKSIGQSAEDRVTPEFVHNIAYNVSNCAMGGRLRDRNIEVGFHSIIV